MKLHERTMHVQGASANIGMTFWQLADDYDLTYGECVKILADLTAQASNYVLRIERHGRVDKKADEA